MRNLYEMHDIHGKSVGIVFTHLCLMDIDMLWNQYSAHPGTKKVQIQDFLQHVLQYDQEAIELEAKPETT